MSNQWLTTVIFFHVPQSMLANDNICVPSYFLQIQLSWNYNYIDAESALDVDLCASLDLVATDEAVSWGTGA